VSVAAARRDDPDDHVIWFLVGAAIVCAGIVLFVVSRRRAPDGVTSFQRQIDALSPEARRSVVDRVQKLDEGSPEGGDLDGP
jgi:hypothetical protein